MLGAGVREEAGMSVAFPKDGWMEGGRRGKAIVRTGGFALDGREGSGHNEGEERIEVCL